MNISIKPLILVPLVLTMSCAASQSAPLQATDTSIPRLIACAEPNLSRSTVPRTSVELKYDVNTEGRVSAVRAVSNVNSNNASDATIAAAKDLALSCVYEPATRDGQPVVATVTRWVSVERPAGSAH